MAVKGGCQGRGGNVKTVRARSRPWGRGQDRGGVAKALGGLQRSWRRGQGRGVMAKAVGRGQGLGGVVKAVRANPNPNPKAVGHS